MLVSSLLCRGFCSSKVQWAGYGMGRDWFRRGTMLVGFSLLIRGDAGSQNTDAK